MKRINDRDIILENVKRKVIKRKKENLIENIKLNAIKKMLLPKLNLTK
jgi:hypothetical protein